MNLEDILKHQPILLYDGECGFCNRSIQYFLAREKKPGIVHFAPLESDIGKQLRSYFEISDKVDSIILIKKHSAYIKSCAALRMTRYMKGAWPALVAFVIIPPFIRNLVYDFIARRRMKILGRVESCEIPEAVDRRRFLAGA